MKLCKVVDCHKTDKDGRVIKGLCEGHYARLKKYGDVLAEPKRAGYCEDKTILGRLKHGTPENLPTSACWEWTKARHDKGYGILSHERRTYRAHRVAYALSSGTEIPKGVVVRHKCDNPPCVNPAHLELGTQADNIRDRVERGRNRSK